MKKLNKKSRLVQVASIKTDLGENLEWDSTELFYINIVDNDESKLFKQSFKIILTKKKWSWSSSVGIYNFNNILE